MMQVMNNKIHECLLNEVERFLTKDSLVVLFFFEFYDPGYTSIESLLSVFLTSNYHSWLSFSIIRIQQESAEFTASHGLLIINTKCKFNDKR